MQGPRNKLQFIDFVKGGNPPKKKKHVYNTGLLYTANDWTLLHDNPSQPLVVPFHIVQTSLRPDIVIYSDATKQVIIIELTVPAEDNIVQQHTDKEFKYSNLCDDINLNKWTGQIFAVEVGSRGYITKSFGYSLNKLGLKLNAIGWLKKAVSLTCLRSSYSIYL